MFQWATGTLVQKKNWHDHLFSLHIHAPKFSFVPGQFVRLGISSGSDTPMKHRAYSIASALDEDHYEFFITSVEGGEVSPLINRLAVGDAIQISQRPSGFFTLEAVPNAKTLWLISTGTGLGPYLSMLKTADTWERFEHIILIHAVRHVHDLAYQTTIQKFIDAQLGRLTYLPIVSREKVQGTLQGRIPALIQSGQIEAFAGKPIDENSQVLLCGNPAMIQDTKALLAERGLELNMRRRPGHVTLEQYWRPDEPSTLAAASALQSAQAAVT